MQLAHIQCLPAAGPGWQLSPTQLPPLFPLSAGLGRAKVKPNKTLM